MTAPRRRLAAPAVLMLAAACGHARAGPADVLEGAWRVVEVERAGDAGSNETFSAQPGQFVFTRFHYSAVFVPEAAERAAFEERWNPTEAEMVAAFESIIVNSGTYEVDGSRLTVRPVIAKTPEFAGGHQVYRFGIEGDVLMLETVEIVSRDGVPLSLPREVIGLLRVE